jgi:hypothetical protein
MRKAQRLFFTMPGHRYRAFVPVTIVRAMKDVEQIARIEEQALPADKQKLLRFYVLQIARLTGDNG